MTTGTTRSHEFTLLLEGPDVLSEDVFAALDEPCEDAIFGHRAGAQFADFERVAPNFPEAVISAIRDIEAAVPALQVIRVTPDELVSAATIATRIGRTPQNVNQMVKGTRGDNDFPAPIAWVDAKTKLWRWSDVAVWWHSRGNPVPAEEIAQSEFVAMLNGRLEARRHHRRLDEMKREHVPEAEQALAAATAVAV